MSYLINHACALMPCNHHSCMHAFTEMYNYAGVHIHQLERLYISYMIHMHACVYTLIYLYVIWLHLLYKTER